MLPSDDDDDGFVEKRDTKLKLVPFVSSCLLNDSFENIVTALSTLIAVF